MQGQTRGEKNKPTNYGKTNFKLSQAANKAAGWLK